MLSNIGIPGLILILVLALIVFGPKKLPEVGSAFGQTLQEFKKATNNMMNDKPTKTLPKEEKHAETEEKSNE